MKEWVSGGVGDGGWTKRFRDLDPVEVDPFSGCRDTGRPTGGRYSVCDRRDDRRRSRLDTDFRGTVGR